MTVTPFLDEAAAWRAVLARDRAADGQFVTGVLTTGIYCRPSCAARHPARTNVRFFADGAAARAAGLRACRRCRPDDLSRESAALAQAFALLDADAAPDLVRLAEAVGYSPSHFHRLFRRATGLTPAAWRRARRAARIDGALARTERITDALYDAGYAAPARFYADAKGRLGMTPSAWKEGGRGVTIRWACADTSFGPMLLAATDRGICTLTFAPDAETQLHTRFPNARIEEGGAHLAELLARTVAAVEDPAAAASLPLDVRGTAFQEKVWQALSHIPPGESLSYAALAARAGKPGAARAAGTACGSNPVAILIPCHRARRGDGSPGGYAWGLDMKAELLRREDKEARLL